MFRLNDEARKYVLYQRTELIDRRIKINKLKKFINKINLFKYKNEINNKKIIEDNVKIQGNNIDINYYKIMNDKAEIIKSALDYQVKSLLDIGCGIAAIDIILYNELKLSKVYLLDKDEIEDDIWYGFSNIGAFYNSLNLAKEICINNGLPGQNIIEIYANENNTIEINKKIDLIISTLSWGFHYPIDTYISQVYELMHEKSLLILDVRKNTSGKKRLEEKFIIEIIDDNDKYEMIKCKK